MPETEPETEPGPESETEPEIHLKPPVNIANTFFSWCEENKCTVCPIKLRAYSDNQKTLE